MSAEFILSAASPEQFPREESPEFAFLGRSNVGKSSLLNNLLREQKLARISSKPGCTQLINFFQVEERFRFVDLPGYGYARVTLEQREKWKGLIESYLAARKTLCLCFLLLDARRGWMEMDLELKRWLEFKKRRYIVIATKFDKLKTQRERHRSLKTIRDQLPDGQMVPFSAITGQGASEIWQAIRKITNKS